MLKTTRRIFLSSPTVSENLKKKIWLTSGIIILVSLLSIDFINVRTANRHASLPLFIKNIHLLIPWGLAYLVASRHRDLLKVFVPLYLSLVLLVASGFQAVDDFTRIQKQNKKFKETLINMFKDPMSGKEPSTESQITYSAEEYGPLTSHLNKIKRVSDIFQQESIAIAQAFSEVGFENIFMDEVLFNFFNIIDKREKLKHLSIFLNESEKKMEKLQSELTDWMLSSPEIDEADRKSFAEAHYKTAEEKEFLRKQSFGIKKNIVREFINCLDFLSKIYGTYARGKDQSLLFSTVNDSQIMSSHLAAINRLADEEEKFSLYMQQYVMQMEDIPL